MTAPLLATRDALAAVIFEALDVSGEHPAVPIAMEERIADALFASGLLRDPASLADDDSVYDPVENAVMVALMQHGHADGCWPDVAAAAFAALAAALTEGPA